ncbi:MAG: substrate-binding domain-containing protein [Burkholderiales bacterium]|nr:substrate-binding domain-containing protein [Burkholderiales bacterium]
MCSLILFRISGRLLGGENSYAKNLKQHLLFWGSPYKELGPNKFEVVAPSVSILAEPPVAVVDKVADKHGTSKVAEAYLRYLYSDEGQEIAARHYYRPVSSRAAAKYAPQFPKIKTFTVDEIFGGWSKAQPRHFGDGGTFDQLYLPGKK